MSSTVEELRNMPDGIHVPISMVKEAFDEYDRRALELAAREEMTIQMYEHLATEHLCEHPTGFEEVRDEGDQWMTQQNYPKTPGAEAENGNRGPTPPAKRE